MSLYADTSLLISHDLNDSHSVSAEALLHANTDPHGVGRFPANLDSLGKMPPLDAAKWQGKLAATRSN